MGWGALRDPPVKPEDLLDPGEFPDDLKWVAVHHKLNPADPVYLLVAWHWRRVKQSEDTLRAGIVEMKAALDSRIAVLDEAAGTIAGINAALEGVEAVLEEKPKELAEQLETKLGEPVTSAVVKLEALEKALAPLERRFQASQRRQLLAALLVGVALGVLSAVVVLLA